MARSACRPLGLLFDPEHGGRTCLRNVGELIPYYKASHHRI
jgi:hypothetical protein